jgi:hypothetical protein
LSDFGRVSCGIYPGLIKVIKFWAIINPALSVARREQALKRFPCTNLASFLDAASSDDFIIIEIRAGDVLVISLYTYHAVLTVFVDGTPPENQYSLAKPKKKTQLFPHNLCIVDKLIIGFATQHDRVNIIYT